MSTGFTIPALAVGLGIVSFKPKRGFFTTANSIVAQATIEEVHHDELEITDHPVERQANISDHAFKRPEEVIIRCAWSNSPVPDSGSLISNVVSTAQNVVNGTISGVQSLLSGSSPNQVIDIYNQLLQLQLSRQPFDVFTGKRQYANMLFKSLSVTTDQKSENALFVTAVCREIILVSTSVINSQINTNAQAQPQNTTPTQNLGTQSLKTPTGTPPTV